jgi:hypothetical protein
MSQQENRIPDSQFSDWAEASAAGDELEAGGLGAARSRTFDDNGGSIVHQLNGPLTALLLYMEELKQHSHRLSRETGERDHLQKVVENALQQTERVCALVKQAGGASMGVASTARKERCVAGMGRAPQGKYEGKHQGKRSVPDRHAVAGRRPEAVDQARARSPQSDQRGLFQQTGRASHADQLAHLRESSGRGDAKARRAQHRRPRPRRLQPLE